MTLYTALSEVPAGYGPSVVTIGNFDGVHRGHARVISRVVSLAEEHGLSSIAVSFDPHPMQVHRPEERVEDFNLYGQRVLIEFVKRLRPMVAYTGVEALIEQINDDVVQTREVLAEDAKNYCPPECPVQAEVKHPHL